jgi:hypothetical protein
MLLCAYRVHRERGGDPVFFGLAILLVLPFFWVGFATIRAQLFTLTAISVQMVMLEADWKGRRAWILGWLVLLFVWLNVHAGFVIGAGMMAFHGLERIVDIAYRQRSLLAIWKGTWHLFLAVPFAVGALWINPYGTEYIVYLAHGLTMARPLIAEWGPLWTTYEPLQTMLAYTVSVALLFYVVRHRQWARLRGFIFLALCAVMALKHIRHGLCTRLAFPHTNGRPYSQSAPSQTKVGFAICCRDRHNLCGVCIMASRVASLFTSNHFQ